MRYLNFLRRRLRTDRFRDCWLAFGIFVGLGPFSFCPADEPSFESVAAPTPNVILILADDLAIGDLATENGGLSRTPNLDRLARQSVWFRNAYSASCVCAPARAALLTGRYPHRTGVVTLNMNRYPKLTRLRLDETTIADVLHRHGYATGLVGKWHVGTGKAFHPMRRGFDEFEGFSGSQDLSYFHYTLDINGEKTEADDRYLTDDLSQRAIDFVRRHHDHPFFLHLAHYAPHRPIEAPADLIRTYQRKGLGESTATIYAMIEVMDRGIGDLLTEIDRLGISENTIVIFASDNGPDPLTGERFNGQRRGMKYEVYEGGIQVPLFVRWTGKVVPGTRQTLIHFVDLFPTILDLCGIQPEADLAIDGASFRNVLNDPDVKSSSVRYWQWNRGVPDYTHNAAIRDGRWKLVRPFVTRGTTSEQSTLPTVLYDLANDPGETIDVSVQHPEQQTKMRSKLDVWSREIESDRNRPLAAF